MQNIWQKGKYKSSIEERTKITAKKNRQFSNLKNNTSFPTISIFIHNCSFNKDSSTIVFIWPCSILRNGITRDVFEKMLKITMMCVETLMSQCSSFTWMGLLLPIICAGNLDQGTELWAFPPHGYFYAKLTCNYTVKQATFYLIVEMQYRIRKCTLASHTLPKITKSVLCV